MGEYAKRKSDGERVKIGTCEDLFYLRWDDIDKLESPGYDLREPGLRFRLPFPDEDQLQPGDYDDYNRGYRLLPYQDEDNGETVYFDADDTEKIPGLVQLTHPMGLLLNVKCYHGRQSPEGSADIQVHWNGKDPHVWELYMVKNHPGEGLLPIVRCHHCGEMFRSTWAAVLLHIRDEELRNRLTDYAAFGAVAA